MPRPPGPSKRTWQVYRAVGEEMLGPLGFEWQVPDWMNLWWRLNPTSTAIQAIRLLSYFPPQKKLGFRLNVDVSILLPPLKAALRAVRGDDLWTSGGRVPGLCCSLGQAVADMQAPPINSPEERVQYQLAALEAQERLDAELVYGFEVIVPPLPGAVERAREVLGKVITYALPWLDTRANLRTLLPLWRTSPAHTTESDHLTKATACWLIGEGEAMEEEIALAVAYAGGLDRPSSFGIWDLDKPNDKETLTVGQFAERLRTTTPEGLGLPPHPERRAARQE